MKQQELYSPLKLELPNFFWGVYVLNEDIHNIKLQIYEHGPYASTHIGLYLSAIVCKFYAFSVWRIDILLSVQSAFHKAQKVLK